MKFNYSIQKCGWSSENCLAFGLAFNIGNNIKSAGWANGSISGFRFGVGLLFVRVDFSAGIPFPAPQPRLKFLKLS